MKITSYTTSINPSEIHETSSKKSLNNIITKVSNCAYAALIFLTTITSLISGAIAYPLAGAAAHPRVALEDPSIPTTTLESLDSVQRLPIDQILVAAEAALPTNCAVIPNHSGLNKKCFKKSQNDSSCTIL